MTDQQKPPSGSAVALQDLVNGSMEEETEPAERAVEVRPRRNTVRVGRAKATKPSQGGGWAGAVPKVQVRRESLNVALPVELDLLRRLRLFSAATGIDVQDFVAAAVHNALNDEGYDLNVVP